MSLVVNAAEALHTLPRPDSAPPLSPTEATPAAAPLVRSASTQPITSHPPPPRRQIPPKPLLPYSSRLSGWPLWKQKMAGWGGVALDKSIVVSDNVGGHVNGWSEWLGTERFWPTSNDFEAELQKCIRILEAFTVKGVGFTFKNPKTGQKTVVRRKLPAKVLREAKGLVLYTSMRNGIAPFGGAGGAGIIVARLEDGQWSAPSFISPNNMAVGAMLGADIMDAILVLRTDEAVASFASNAKVTIGGEIAVAAGGYGTGISAESGKDRQPILSYVRSRGLYAGVEILAQAFLARFDENERVYHWPGIKQGDILSGRVRAPREAEPFYAALDAAESGVSQRLHGADKEFEEFDEAMSELPNLDLEDGETLKLPPTPDQLEQQEEEEEWKRTKAERDNLRYLR